MRVLIIMKFAFLVSEAVGVVPDEPTVLLFLLPGLSL